LSSHQRIKMAQIHCTYPRTPFCPAYHQLLHAVEIKQVQYTQLCLCLICLHNYLQETSSLGLWLKSTFIGLNRHLKPVEVKDGVRFSAGARICSLPCPDRLGSSPSLLSSGYRDLFPRG